MPTFSPTIALFAISASCSRERSARTSRRSVDRLCRGVPPTGNHGHRFGVVRPEGDLVEYSERPEGPSPGGLRRLDLDLDVDTRRQLEALEGVDGLGAVLDDVEQPL